MLNGNGHEDEYFISPSRGKRDFLGSINDIVEFINEDVVSRYAVVVGTDSDETVVPNGHAGLADFVSVITVHRIGKHGRYFWKRISNVQTFDRHDRMLKEAYFSLELAQFLSYSKDYLFGDLCLWPCMVLFYQILQKF